MHIRISDVDDAKFLADGNSYTQRMSELLESVKAPSGPPLVG